MYRYLCLLCLSILIGFSFSMPASSQESGLELLLAARNCRLPYRWIDNVCRDLGGNVTPPPPVQFAADIKNSDAIKNVAKNIVNVPQNCQKDQQLINGECRDVWLQAKETDANSNVVTAPNNCPAGQEWINGQCRDVWASILDALNNVVTPNNTNYLSNLIISALDKQSFDDKTDIQQNSVLEQSKINKEDNDIEAKNIITVPNQCPDGFRPDSNGKCREIW